jgi:hypothetical protein
MELYFETERTGDNVIELGVMTGLHDGKQMMTIQTMYLTPEEAFRLYHVLVCELDQEIAANKQKLVDMLEQIETGDNHDS